MLRVSSRSLVSLARSLSPSLPRTSLPPSLSLSLSLSPSLPLPHLSLSLTVPRVSSASSLICRMLSDVPAMTFATLSTMRERGCPATPGVSGWCRHCGKSGGSRRCRHRR